MKQRAVEMKGGECMKCGWSDDIAALTFHHRDPNVKEFTVSSYKTTNWDIYWKEIEKCDLLCSNCHLIFHSDHSDPQFLKDVKNYKGRELIVGERIWKNGYKDVKNFKKNCEYCQSPFESRISLKKFCGPMCSQKAHRKCVRPSKEELTEQFNGGMNFTKLGEKYGVTGNSIKKWCRSYNLIPEWDNGSPPSC